MRSPALVKCSYGDIDAMPRHSTRPTGAQATSVSFPEGSHGHGTVQDLGP